MNEWIEELGKRIMFESVDRAWNNGANERNREYEDTMIKNRMEEDTKHLNDSLIKVVAWMHNTCINKMGGVLLELVTGLEMEVIRLTMDEDGWRNMEDEEVIQ